MDLERQAGLEPACDGIRSTVPHPSRPLAPCWWSRWDSKLYPSLTPRKLLKTRCHYCQRCRIYREPLHPIAPALGAGSESRRQCTGAAAAEQFYDYDIRRWHEIVLAFTFAASRPMITCASPSDANSFLIAVA